MKAGQAEGFALSLLTCCQCFPPQWPDHTTPAASHPSPSRGAAVLQGPGAPMQQHGHSLGHPRAAASLFLAAARHGDRAAFILV